jgi:hypothetical protein
MERRLESTAGATIHLFKLRPGTCIFHSFLFVSCLLLLFIFHSSSSFSLTSSYVCNIRIDLPIVFILVTKMGVVHPLSIIYTVNGRRRCIACLYIPGADPDGSTITS